MYGFIGVACAFMAVFTAFFAVRAATNEKYQHNLIELSLLTAALMAVAYWVLFYKSSSLF